MKSPLRVTLMSVGLNAASVPQSCWTLGCCAEAGKRTITFVAFVPCLMHDLRNAAVFDGGEAGAFGGAGIAAGAAGADEATLA